MTRSKRVISIALALALVAALSVPALALGDIVLTEDGFVTINVADEMFREDLGEAQVHIAVYKVADVNEHGAFTLRESFAPLSENEQWNGGILNGNTRVQDLLDAALALIGPTEEPAEGEEAVPAIAPDFETDVSAVNGQIALAEYGLGLYLLVPGDAETTQWVYHFNPVLLAVPSIQRESSTPPEEGEEPDPGQSGDGEWLYNVPVNMKGEREYRLTELVIDKTLQRYNASLGPTTFVFQIEATLNGEVVYSNVVSLTFSGAGTQSVTVTGIPVGAHVTVTEVYSGASYEVVDGQVSVDIEELPLPGEDGATRVAFTNDYDDTLVPDTSVVNTYEYDGSGWRWVSGEEA